MEIKKLEGHDLPLFIELVRLFEDVFGMENFIIPAEEHLQRVLQSPGFYVYVAIVDDMVVGGLTAYTLEQYYSASPLVYVYDLAVKTSYQRQGIGTNLMLALQTYCTEIGVEEVFVQANEEDEHAVAFYYGTQATAEKVLHFYYPLKRS